MLPKLARVAILKFGGAFGDNWAADRLSRADALGGFLALHFEPGFRLMYAAIGITADHFRASYFKELLKAVNDYDRQVLLRPGFEVCLLRRERRMFRARQRRAGSRQRTALPELGLRRDEDRAARSPVAGSRRYAGCALHQQDDRGADARRGLASGRGRRSFCGGRRRGRDIRDSGRGIGSITDARDTSARRERKGMKKAKAPAKKTRDRPEEGGGSLSLKADRRQDQGDLGDWRGETLARVRAIIRQADPDDRRDGEMAKAVEPRGRSGMGARRHHLHRRDLQGGGEADLRQRRFACRPVTPVQFQPRRQYAARHRYSRGRHDRRERR